MTANLFLRFVRERLALWGAAPLLIMIITWHLLEHAEPGYDPAEYLDFGARPLVSWHTEGAWDALTRAYWDRPWKPLLTSVLATPFLAIAGLQVRLAVLLANLFFTAFFVLQLSGLLRRFLHGWRLNIALLLITSAPWFLWTTAEYMSTLPHLALLSACFVSLLASENFTQRAPSVRAGLFFALAACVRPAETLAAMVGPVWLALKPAIRNDRAMKIHVGLAAILSVVTLGILAHQGVPENNPGREILLQQAVGLCILVATWMVVARRQLPASHFPLFFSLGFAGPVLWFFPFAQELRYWTLWCTLDAATPAFNVMFPPPRLQPLDFLLRQFKSLAGVPFSLLILAAALRIHRRESSFPHGSDVGVSLLSMIAVTATAGMLTNVSDPRLYELPMLGALAVLSVLILHGSAVPVIMGATVLAIGLNLSANLVMLVFSAEHPVATALRAMTANVPWSRPPDRREMVGPEIGAEIAQWLKEAKGARLLHVPTDSSFLRLGELPPPGLRLRMTLTMLDVTVRRGLWEDAPEFLSALQDGPPIQAEYVLVGPVYDRTEWIPHPLRPGWEAAARKDAYQQRLKNAEFMAWVSGVNWEHSRVARFALLRVQNGMAP